MGVFDKLKAGLAKTRNSALSLLDFAFSADGRIDSEFYEEIEEALIMADVGAALSSQIIEALREEIKRSGIKLAAEARPALRQILTQEMQPGEPFSKSTPLVILIAGVNGVGKTTSAGKLAHIYKSEGKNVMLAAADTFRAAAAEQLTLWAKRADVPIIKHGEGADPAAVVFDAIAAAKARDVDVLICDTAGRLHNKKNLMQEFGKIERVIGREYPHASVETLLVLDATTGQNAIAQAREFGRCAKLTGIVLTKLDGTAKGGVAIAVKSMLNIPVRFVGVGEGIDDMQPFDPEAFAQALL